ncbi:MAG: hypothetical protein KC457_35560, partial [Myxococcales bacterium]|nr:hypothetical protein [Myxococcales bacterium]
KVMAWLKAEDYEGQVLVRGGPGSLRVQEALLERGLDCRQVHAWPGHTGAVVEVAFVCPVCCIL